MLDFLYIIPATIKARKIRRRVLWLIKHQPEEPTTEIAVNIYNEIVVPLHNKRIPWFIPALQPITLDEGTFHA
jgi:hypothetical protein